MQTKRSPPPVPPRKPSIKVVPVVVTESTPVQSENRKFAIGRDRKKQGFEYDSDDENFTISPMLQSIAQEYEPMLQVCFCFSVT